MNGRRFSRGGALPLFAAAMAFGCATAAPPTPPPTPPLATSSATSSVYSSAPVRGASQAAPDTTGVPGAGVGSAAGAGDATGARFAAPGAFVTRVLDTSFDDPSRDRRLPVRLRVPQPCTSGERRPVVLFSHGLGGSRAGGAHWGEHWSAHGFAVLHLQHPGSDEALWRGRPGGFSNLAGLRAGATPEQFVLRAQDVRAAIDALARRVAADPTLACLDVVRLGMSGHSFGAQTTQAIAGQSLPVPGGGAARPWLVEPRVRAAIAFSPSMRDGGPAARAAFGTVGIPFLAITGGLDGDVLGTGTTAALRRAVFDALPAGDRFLMWFGGGDHMVFNGGPPRPAAADGRDDDVRVQRVTAAVTLAFWKAMLTGDAAARAWLDAGGPRSLLGDADVWSSR